MIRRVVEVGVEGKEVEVVDSREAEVDLMVKVEDLIILCKVRENLNGKVMT